MNVNEKHLLDLAERSYERNYNTFSEFLNLDEISSLYALSLPVDFSLYGGYEGAERRVACFGNGEYADYPIDCIRLSPVSRKFADSLTHRDFLGAVMNLGINRNTVGDIVIKDNIGYLFCLESISDYIISNLTRIKHTTVSCTLEEKGVEFTPPEPETLETTVSSLRADAVCASVYRLSRSGMSELFREKKVFINSRLCEKESVALKEGDIVSVRGYGRFVFGGEIRETKRKRLAVRVFVYK